MVIFTPLLIVFSVPTVLAVVFVCLAGYWAFMLLTSGVGNIFANPPNIASKYRFCGTCRVADILKRDRQENSASFPAVRLRTVVQAQKARLAGLLHSATKQTAHTVA